MLPPDRLSAPQKGELIKVIELRRMGRRRSKMAVPSFVVGSDELLSSPLDRRPRRRRHSSPPSSGDRERKRGRRRRREWWIRTSSSSRNGRRKMAFTLSICTSFNERGRRALAKERNPEEGKKENNIKARKYRSKKLLPLSSRQDRRGRIGIEIDSAAAAGCFFSREVAECIKAEKFER